MGDSESSSACRRGLCEWRESPCTNPELGRFLSLAGERECDLLVSRFDGATGRWRGDVVVCCCVGFLGDGFVSFGCDEACLVGGSGLLKEGSFESLGLRIEVEGVEDDRGDLED